MCYCALIVRRVAIAMAEAKIAVTVKDNSVNIRLLSHNTPIIIEHVVSIEVFQSKHYYCIIGSQQLVINAHGFCTARMCIHACAHADVTREKHALM